MKPLLCHFGVTAREAPSLSPQVPRISLSTPARPWPVPARRRSGRGQPVPPCGRCRSPPGLRCTAAGSATAPRHWGHTCAPSSQGKSKLREPTLPVRTSPAAASCKFPLAPSYTASPIRADPLIPPHTCVLGGCPHPRYPLQTPAITQTGSPWKD